MRPWTGSPLDTPSRCADPGTIGALGFDHALELRLELSCGPAPTGETDDGRDGFHFVRISRTAWPAGGRRVALDACHSASFFSAAMELVNFGSISNAFR